MEVVLKRLPLPNMIGWLGATAVFFPESERSREQNLVELSLGEAAMTLSVQVDLRCGPGGPPMNWTSNESNSSEMRLFRIAISGFPTDCCPSTWRLDPGLRGWSSVFVVAAPGSPGQVQHSSVPAGTTLSLPPLFLPLFRLSLPSPPPVFSNRGPAWQTGTRPFRRPFASSPYFSLFSSSAVPLLLISLLLLLAGIHPHPGPYQLRSRDIERTRRRPSPLMCPPLWPPLPALSPASFTLSPLAYSPSVPLLPPSSPYDSCEFYAPPLVASPTTRFWSSPPP